MYVILTPRRLFFNSVVLNSTKHVSQSIMIQYLILNMINTWNSVVLTFENFELCSKNREQNAELTSCCPSQLIYKYYEIDIVF